MKNTDFLMSLLTYQLYLLENSTIPLRDKELQILRIAWLSGSDYMWSVHKTRGSDWAGISTDEIERIKEGPDAEGWDPFETTLLRAVDELHVDAFISDATWKALSERYSANQLLDMLGLAAFYFGAAMMLKTLGVQL